MIGNALCTINKFGGYYYDLSLGSIGTSIPVILLPAENRIMSLYPDLPIGQTYTFVCMDDSIADIPPESEIIVSDPQMSGLTIGDKFITQELARKQMVFGSRILTGICIKVLQ